MANAEKIANPAGLARDRAGIDRRPEGAASNLQRESEELRKQTTQELNKFRTTKQDLDGKLISEDGKSTYNVKSGDIFNEKGKFIGSITNEGMVFEARRSSPTDINSFANKFRFEGSENGRSRKFTISTETCTGKLFLKDKGSGAPHEYAITMGMVIDKKTGVQIATFQPPKETTRGELHNGSLLFADGTVKSLSSLEGAVFDVKLMGQTGQKGRRLQGVCRGEQNGGFFNIAEAIASERRKIDASDVKETDVNNRHWFQRIPDIWSDQGRKDLEKASSLRADGQQAIAYLDSVLRTGSYAMPRLKQLDRDLVASKQPSDPLLAKKAALDSRVNVLEKLPARASSIDGYVIIPKSNGQATKLTIKDGQLLAVDGKTAIAKLSTTGGEPKLTNVVFGDKKDIPIKNLSSSVWHLNFADGSGKPAKVSWVSMGKDGMVSLGDLKKQAQDEARYAKEFASANPNEQSKQAVAQANQRLIQFQQRVDKMSLKGVGTIEDLKFVAEGPRAHVRPDMLKKQGAPEKEAIKVPELNNKNVKEVNGRLRVGNEVFSVRNGQLFKIHEELNDAKVVMTTEKKACGELKSGYVVKLDGREPLVLAKENRVLFEFSLKNEPAAQKHRLIGLGNARITQNFGAVEGGLVEVSELKRQAREFQAQAQAANTEYFNKRPVVTGNLGNWALGDREAILRQFADTLKGNTDDLDIQTNMLFRDGFSQRTFHNNKLDRTVEISQLLLHNIGSTADDAGNLAAEGQALQQQFNDAVVMVALTAATAGIGTAFAAPAGAARSIQLANMTKTALVAAPTGGLIRVGLSKTQGGGIEEIKRNFAAGNLEALSMVGGQQIGSALKGMQLNRASALAKLGQGQQLTKAESLLANRLSYYGGQAGLRTLDASGQAVLFNTSAAIRDEKLSLQTSLNPEMTAYSTLAALGGQTLGRLVPGRTESISRLSGGNRMENLRKLAAQAVDDYIGRMPGEAVDSTTSSLMENIAPAIDAERQKVAQKFGIAPEAVSNELLKKHANMNAIYDMLIQQAAMSTGISTFSSAGTTALHTRLTPLRPGNHVPPARPETSAIPPIAWNADGKSTADTKLVVKSANTKPIEKSGDTKSIARAGETTSNHKAKDTKPGGVERAVQIVDDLLLRLRNPLQSLRQIPQDVQAMVTTSGAPSSAFVDNVHRLVERIPPGERALLQRNGYTISAARTVLDVAPDVHGMCPRGWPPERTWENADGLYRPGQIVVAERYNLVSGHEVNNSRVAGVLYHETGHALDDLLGGISTPQEYPAQWRGGSRRPFSETTEFRRAYAKDWSNMRNLSPEQLDQLEYFLQQNGGKALTQAGASEAFAEVYACLRSNGTLLQFEPLFRRAFPRTFAIIEGRLRRLEVEHRATALPTLSRRPDSLPDNAHRLPPPEDRNQNQPRGIAVEAPARDAARRILNSDEFRQNMRKAFSLSGICGDKERLWDRVERFEIVQATQRQDRDSAFDCIIALLNKEGKVFAYGRIDFSLVDKPESRILVRLRNEWFTDGENPRFRGPRAEDHFETALGRRIVHHEFKFQSLPTGREMTLDEVRNISVAYDADQRAAARANRGR